jgi:hypothetical protein
MEFELPALIYGGLIPGLVSTIGLCLAGLSSSRWARPLAGIFIFASVLAGYFVLKLGTFPPAERWELLPWLALAACLISFFELQVWLVAILYAALAVAAGIVLVPKFERLADERFYWLMVFPAVLGVTIESSVLQARKLIGPALPYYWLLITAAGTALVLFANLLKFTHMGGMLVAIMMGCLIAACFFPARALASALASGWSLFFSGLVLEARLATFSEVPLVSYVLVLVAPLMIWLTAIPGVRKMKPVWRTTIGTICVLAPLAIGLFWAGQVSLHDVEEW